MKMKHLLTSILFIIYFFASSNTVTAQTKTDLPCIDKKFSIVAHLVLDSLGSSGVTEAEINSGIALLNNAFKDICIFFEVCVFENIENFSYNTFNQDSSLNELISTYNKKNRINMYFVSQIIAPAGENGLATQNGITILDTSAIIIRKGNDIFSNMAHQMGHYFGLLNTFGETTTELVDGSNCATTGDNLCDTPADPYLINETIASHITGCRFISTKKDAKGQYYQPHVANFMSNYVNCGCEYSRSQLKIMADTYNAGKGMW
jgi:hypothetical protein